MSTDTPTPSTVPPAAPPRPGAPGEDFFSRIRQLGVVRPDDGRWAAGVAAGLARRWGVDPLLVRGAFVALSVLGGAGVFLYGLGWMFLPHPDGRIHAQEVLQGRVTAGFVGAVVAILCNVPSTGFGWNDGPFGWGPGGIVSVIVVGSVLWFVVRRHGGAPASPHAAGSADPTAFEPAATGGPSDADDNGERPTPGWVGPGQNYAGHNYYAGQGYAGQGYAMQPRLRDVHAPSHALTQVTLGIAVLTALGVVGLSRLGVGLHGYTWLVATALALGVVGLGLVVAGLLGRRGGGLIPIAIVLAVVSVNGATLRGSSDAVGERTWKPASVAAAQAGYQLGAGDAVLDLTDPALLSAAQSAQSTPSAPSTPSATGSTGPLRVAAHIGVGQLRIVVPTGVPVEVDATVGLGQVADRVNDVTIGGGGNERVIRSGGSPAKIIVTAELGLGNLEVVPQGTLVTTGGTR